MKDQEGKQKPLENSTAKLYDAY